MSLRIGAEITTVYIYLSTKFLPGGPTRPRASGRGSFLRRNAKRLGAAEPAAVRAASVTGGSAAPAEASASAATGLPCRASLTSTQSTLSGSRVSSSDACCAQQSN
jgi:hypothetical protein